MLQQAAAIGRAVAANRWRAARLRKATEAIGAVLDDAGNMPALPEKVRDDLRGALVAVAMHAVTLETSP
jgi:hypothetical protein